MAKKYKQKRKKFQPPARSVANSRAAAEESRQSVALTVGWMLSLVVTLAAEAIAISAAVAERVRPVQPGAGISAGTVASLFLFVSLVTGLVSAVLVPVVQRVRVVPPPRAITWVALAAAAIPPVTILFRWLF